MKSPLRLFWLLAMLLPGAIVARAQDGTRAQAPVCSLSGANMDAFAALDYDAFNYGPDGWRKLAENKCYYEAAASIVSWLTDHENALNPAQLRTQHYQAARNFALAGRKPVAMVQLRMAREARAGTGAAMDWNAFMDAFAAWLNADRAGLDAAIARLERQSPGKNGRKPNLVAAQRFARCFERDYIAIEQDASCLASSASEKTP